MYQHALLKHASINLGDEIQSLAAKQFLPRVDCMLDRDGVESWRLDRPTKIILNGWFKHRPEEWPPKDSNVTPLFISFHIADDYDSSVDLLTGEKAISYYKKHAPIGCRDLHTMKLLRAKGVEAYFSGCLTLTLRNPFSKRTDKIYFVDVDPAVARALLPSRVSEEVLFLKHEVPLHTPLADKFCLAQTYLNNYASAKLVVTSRLHCALPCVAFGTPVIFINKNLSDPRFSGLIHLLRHYSCEVVRKGLVRINWNNPGPNPVDISEMRGRLIASCRAFTSVNEKSLGGLSAPAWRRGIFSRLRYGCVETFVFLRKIKGKAGSFTRNKSKDNVSELLFARSLGRGAMILGALILLTGVAVFTTRFLAGRSKAASTGSASLPSRAGGRYPKETRG